MLWTIVIILVVLWLLGSLVHIGGSLINLLLVVSVIRSVFGSGGKLTSEQAWLRVSCSAN